MNNIQFTHDKFKSIKFGFSIQCNLDYPNNRLSVGIDYPNNIPMITV